MAEFPPVKTQTTNISFIYYKAGRVYLKIPMVLCISHTISILFSYKIHPNEKGSEQKELVNVSKKRNSCQSRNFFLAKTKHLQKCKDQSKTEVGDNLLAKYRVHGSTVEESDQIIKGNSFHQLVNILA